jgi:hypothetical protein
VVEVIGLGAILLHSNAPSFRVAGFEDEAPDEAFLRRGRGLLEPGFLFTVQTEKQENQTEQKASGKR